MAMKQSTGLCQALLTTADFKTTFDGGYLVIYSGTAPATADAAETGTILVVVVPDADPCTVWAYPFDGTGGTFDEPVAGTIAKAVAETWEGQVKAGGGTATHYRLITATEAADGSGGGVSTTYPRLQGTIGLGGTDMVVGNNVLVGLANFPVNYFTQSLVPS